MKYSHLSINHTNSRGRYKITLEKYNYSRKYPFNYVSTTTYIAYTNDSELYDKFHSENCTKKTIKEVISHAKLWGTKTIQY